MYFLIPFLFSFSLLAAPTTKELSESPKWIRLLHYKKTLFGTYESEADGRKFFLHEKGKTDPLKELERTIKLFGENNSKLDDGHPICRFPLRFKWLNQELGRPWKVDISQCGKYVSFFSKLAARRASVVFSSYYLGNPNSAFGHTLLRLSRYDNRHETEMLDYGINYAAEARESNPFLYAIKGLFGGFKGKFAAVPYYYKIREYTNVEFRDLWSYDLKVTVPQVLEMVDHVWELGQTDFDYFYFHENCSYHLLSIIEVAVPEAHLTDKYHLYTIPADTIRLLKAEGLIQEGQRRESTYSKLTRLSGHLTTDSLRTSKEIALHPENTSSLVAGMENQKAADILDVSIEAFDYYNFERILTDEPKAKEKKSFILSERAKNPVITYDKLDLELTKKDSPALSHSPTRLSFSEGYTDRLGKFSRFEFRAALHDVLDPAQGSLETSQIEMAKFSFKLQDKFYGNPKLILDDLTIFNIKNYREQNFWASPISWEVDLGIKQVPRWNCLDCPMGHVSASVGNSLTVGNKFLISILLNGELNLHNYYTNDYRIAVGPKIFTRYKFSDKFFASFEALYQLNTYETNSLMNDQDVVFNFETRYHLNEKFSLRLQLNERKHEERVPSGEIGFQYFY